MLRRWVDAFVAPSAFMAEMLVGAGMPAERVRAAYYGVPIDDSYRPPEYRYVLFVGRLSPEKGIRTLLDAARRCSEIPFLIAGDGPLAGEVKSAGGNVRYAGVLDAGGVKRAMTQSTFTVVPSEWYENCPMSILESFAVGRAVVATRIGGLPELVSDEVTGLLVEPGSPDMLASAIGRLWHNREIGAEMGRRAQAAARERFSLHRQTEVLVELYSTLTAGEGPS
jgi:glycosyltransferase involved in cell wall biosynthesis